MAYGMLDEDKYYGRKTVERVPGVLVGTRITL
jgi:hypothetical protein